MNLLNIRNAAGTMMIDIIGGIGEGPNTVTAIKNAIDDAKRQRLTRAIVSINSPGGSAMHGIQIHALLRESGLTITTKVDAYALSSGCIIAMAGAERHIAANALLMIHETATYTEGGIREHEQSVEAMSRLNDQKANIIAATTGQTVEKIRQMMRDETWLDAQQALDMGFATRIIEANRMAASFDLDKYNYQRIAACAKQKHGMSAAKRWAIAKDEAKAAVSEFDQRRNPAALINWIDRKYPALRQEFIEETNAKAQAQR